jgi:hypothetical protein
MKKEFRQKEEIIAEILARYSITDLIEQTDEDLDRADELFYKSTTPIQVIDTGEAGAMTFWKILSGPKFYEVRRFRNFVWCSCTDFFFRKKACKHIAVSTRVFCINCRMLPARHDKLCHDCHVHSTAFLKPTPTRTFVSTGTL